ncbi:unnamed protein product [Peniophora sp. CBMAI 1063]|nr:unnamed protein product [Peniophora sp. CBMAI 1063]
MPHRIRTTTFGSLSFSLSSHFPLNHGYIWSSPRTMPKEARKRTATRTRTAPEILSRSNQASNQARSRRGEALRLATSGHSLLERFESLHQLEDLHGAIAAQERAAELMHEGHPRWLYLADDLASSLRHRFENLGTLCDIDRAIALQERALELTAEENSNRPWRLDCHATCLRLRYETIGTLRDLERAITTQRLALTLAADASDARPVYLANLANSLGFRFKRLGELRDLEEAIAADKLAIDLTPECHPDRPRRLSNLAVFLRFRFDRLGEPRDLEEAIAAGKLAVDLTPEGHFERARRLSNLALSLRSRFQRLGELRDLEEAIAAHKLAVDLTPEGHPDRPRQLSNLASSLRARFEHLGELRDLEEAIAANKLAVNLTPEGHPDRARLSSNLANSLRTRFERLGELRDLEEAIAATKLAVDLTPEGHPDRTDRLWQMGYLVKALLAIKPSKIRFDAALEQMMKATVQTLGYPASRLKSAQACISLLSEYPQFSSAELVLEAHAKIIQIFPEIVWLGHSLERRYSESARLGSEVNSAIAAFIRLRSRYQAIEWMEAGRSLVWSQMFSLRQPLEDLERVHPELASNLRQISLSLQHSDSSSQPTPAQFRHGSERPGPVVAGTAHGMTTTADEGAAPSSVDRRRQLAIDYDDLLRNIRRQEGFEDFLRPAKINSLLTSIEHLDGPVVFINVHSSSCDALVLFPNGGIEHIGLPKLSESRAQGLRSTWTEFLRSSGLRVRGVIPAGRLVKGRMNMLGKVLKQLWTCIVRPILKALHFLNDAPSAEHALPHITWCATGPLTQLPLHAAGIYDHPQSLSHTYDFVVSSCTPSLSALLRCHRQPGTRQQVTRPNVLIVAQPDTPTYASLPHTKDECERLRAAMSERAYTFDSLVHEQGTVANALHGIGHHHWVHLACHGKQSAVSPTQSAFVLYDGQLTLAALMGTVAENAELAFLSACQTAVGDEKIPEESAHLAAGMLAVGFKGVIGTMWSIWDADAPIIVEAYYGRLHKLRNSGRDGDIAPGYTGAAYALHDAVKVLRERVGEQNFMQWASFVHFGV